MVSSGRPRADTRQSAEDKEAWPPPKLEPEDRSVGAIHSPNNENVRYLIIHAARNFKQYGNGTISASEFDRSL